MRKFNLHQLKKLRALSTHELHCIKGGRKGGDKGNGCPPSIGEFGSNT